MTLQDFVESPERLVRTEAGPSGGTPAPEKTVPDVTPKRLDLDPPQMTPTTPDNRYGDRPVTAPTQAEAVDTFRDWMNTVVRDYVPDVTEAALVNRMKQPLFRELLQERMSEMVKDWVQGEGSNPLVPFLRQELETHVTRMRAPKFVLVERTESLDQPQVIEEPRPDTAPYLPALPGDGPPGGDPSEGTSSDDDRRRRGRKKDKQKKKKAKSKKKKRKKKKKYDSSSSDPSETETDSSDESSESSSSEEEKPKRRKKKKATKANLKVFIPLNDWYVKACDYHSYRLRDRDGQYTSSVAEKIPKHRKRLEPQMKNRTFSGQDPITILAFLNWFQKACDQCGISEGAALWCFQFFLTGQAYDILQSRLAGGSVAVDISRKELLHSYKEVVNFLIHMYVTDEVISDEYNNIMQYRQATAMTEMDFANKLWEKAQRSGTVYSDRRLKSIFADNLQPALRRSVNHYLATQARKDVTYHELARYAQGLGDQLRGAARGPSRGVGFQTVTGHDEKRTRSPVVRRNPVMTVEDEEESYPLEEEGEEGDAILAVGAGSAAGPSTISTPSWHTAPSTHTPKAQRGRSPVRNVAYVGAHRAHHRHFDDRRFTPGMAACRLCLDEHPTTECLAVPAVLREQLLAARDRNYAQRREDGTWLPRPGTPPPRGREIPIRVQHGRGATSSHAHQEEAADRSGPPNTWGKGQEGA